MSTTELFVELIVVGVGASIWIVLLVLTLFGLSWHDLNTAFSLPALLPALSVTYVLGIVVDRVADSVFEILWGQALFKRFYNSKTDYYNDRRLIYSQATRLVDLLEYGRSRLRICRGWTLNALITLLVLNIFALSRLNPWQLKAMVCTSGTLALALLAYGTWFSWYKINANDLRKVKEQAEYLRQQNQSR
jgi:hypothetical protein